MLPPSNILPHTYWDLSFFMKDIGMHYEEIHACPYDHVIYYNQHEFAMECPKFHISRYRTDQVTKKVHHDIPIITCLQWLFRWKNIIQCMYYHAHNRSQDDILWMPTNGYACRDM